MSDQVSSSEKESRARMAIDFVAQNIYTQNQKDGKNTTFEQAQERARSIAESVDRKGGPTK